MSKVEIIIDPGHGGKDGGGGTNQFWKEKDLALKISLYQFERFNELGVPVALTRNLDIYLSPDERTKIVRDSGAKYCLSNHINAGGGDGFEAIHSIHADGKLENLMAQKIREARQNVRRVFCKESTKVKGKDYYFMHRETGSVHTTIAEYGFADSKLDDVQQLQNGWKKYAEAVVMAYCSYLDYPYKPYKDKEEELKVDGVCKINYKHSSVLNGVIINGVSYAPVRQLSELQGLVVGWEQKTSTVTLD